MQILPFQIKAAFRNTDLINETASACIICQSGMVGIFTSLPIYNIKTSPVFYTYTLQETVSGI